MSMPVAAIAEIQPDFRCQKERPVGLPAVTAIHAQQLADMMATFIASLAGPAVRCLPGNPQCYAGYQN